MSNSERKPGLAMTTKSRIMVQMRIAMSDSVQGRSVIRRTETLLDKLSEEDLATLFEAIERLQIEACYLGRKYERVALGAEDDRD